MMATRTISRRISSGSWQLFKKVRLGGGPGYVFFVHRLVRLQLYGHYGRTTKQQRRGSSNSERKRQSCRNLIRSTPSVETSSATSSSAATSSSSSVPEQSSSQRKIGRAS